ncbi:hypothetical protein [Ancylobacter vacuolatus]|uniref:Uncharacterized protein n=1 Tax=Ancylobacter vacuolatus TaxID=223389 RepID=A0ABU0DN31_9HYPH|nr:hypothetical protein [Ancylobacter vacuolatus]MDQ0349764.1 hypothetical protein [Ancylobacter vacuolatus]
MHPAHHESALVAFFRRHGLVAPHTEADGLIERHGLVLAMGFAMRDAHFRATPAEGGAFAFGNHVFAVDDWMAASGDAHCFAQMVAECADTRRLVDRAPTYEALVDRMALDMRRLDLAGIHVMPDTLACEGYTSAEIAEAAITAAQLAEAMKVAQARYWQARKAATEAARVCEAA